MNITDTIEPKVDQLTADHLVGRTMTIRITGVRLTPGEQPCEIEYEGGEGLPYRPGKSMRRVLVYAWGPNATEYVGRSLRLYRDDDVQFGGLKVGGIRISHMSHIDAPLTLALTAKKGSKKAFKVQPLEVEQPRDAAREVADIIMARIKAAASEAELRDVTADPKVVKNRAALREKRPELADEVDAAVTAAMARLGDDFPGVVTPREGA